MKQFKHLLHASALSSKPFEVLAGITSQGWGTRNWEAPFTCCLGDLPGVFLPLWDRTAEWLDFRNGHMRILTAHPTSVWF